MAMTETEAWKLVESWELDEDQYDTNGCVEDLVDGFKDKAEILARNEYYDDGDDD
jgi:hypothetical protein